MLAIRSRFLNYWKYLLKIKLILISNINAKMIYMITTQQVIREINSDTKIKIICWLFKSQKLNVTEITNSIQEKTRINISKQLNELKVAGLVISESMGRNNYYSINVNLDQNIIHLIKTIVNSFHIVDEQKSDFIPYK